MKKNGCNGFLVGDSWTIADFLLLTITHTQVTHEFYADMYGDVFKDFPELQKYTEDRVSELKEYYEARKNYPITYIIRSKLQILDEESS